MTHKIVQGPYILRPKDRLFYALRTVYFTPQGPFILRFKARWNDRIEMPSIEFYGS